MESYEQGYEQDRFENAVSGNYRCPICLNVFKQPVMCQRNQHIFCRPCITRHLTNSQTCPSCKEELTLDTLTPVPRIVMGCLSEFNIRCDYFNRGCRDFMQLGDLENHVKDCGFTPVVCSNEGCLVEINKLDRIHHETEVCEFRKVECHNCAKMSKEMDEIKTTLMAVQNEITELKMNQNDKVKHGVVVAGGLGINSVEMFDCSRRSWAPLQPMKENREGASSFVYKKRFTVTGGYTNDGLTDSMKSMAINPTLGSTQWIHFPVKLPCTLYGHSSVVYNGRLIVIGGFDGEKYSDSIHEVSLDPPYTGPKFLTTMPERKMYAGVEIFNEKILIVGGRNSDHSKYSLDSVTMYDINKNQCKQMAPLPFAVHEMATVSWGDNVVVIGGAGKDGKELDSVVIYNVQSEKSHMLPAMKYKRRGCAAVVTGNAIVVMGGHDERFNSLKSVESFGFNRYSWKELPSMNEARAFPTAVAW